MDIENFFINRDNTALLVIDIQERLIAAMKPEIQESIKKNTSILIETSKIHNMPIVVSEQYKKGLGPTVTELSDKMSDADYLEKIHFDCMKDDGLQKKMTGIDKKNIIIAGMEAHVCVFQTALSLLKSGCNVIIASDAVSSRRKHDWETALKALSGAGAVIYPTETISFMILEKAGTPEFKSLAPMFK